MIPAALQVGSLMSELLTGGSSALGIALEQGTSASLDALRAYAVSVASYPTAVKEVS